MPVLTLAEFEPKRTILVDAPAGAVEKFLASLEDHGKCVAEIHNNMPVDDDDVDLMLDEDGKVIFDRNSFVKNSYQSWPAQVQIEKEYKAGYRNVIYLITPEKNHDDKAVDLRVIQNWGAANHYCGRRLLEASLHIANHSPDGFAFGYNGSGPAQLALAILLNEFGDPVIAIKNYQAFKEHVISKLSGVSCISGEFVRQWTKDQLNKK
jgi:hypothetical protein